MPAVFEQRVERGWKTAGVNPAARRKAKQRRRIKRERNYS
jgi:hypothetical protein